MFRICLTHENYHTVEWKDQLSVSVFESLSLVIITALLLQRVFVIVGLGQLTGMSLYSGWPGNFAIKCANCFIRSM